MRTVIRRTSRPWWYDFLFGVFLGFVGGLVRPVREACRKPAAPPAPRPIEVPIVVAQEEPIWLPVSFPAASGSRQTLHLPPARPTARIGGSGGAP